MSNLMHTNTLPPGFILINKPADWTSHDVVGYLRARIKKGVKIGHAGTLDPFATGLLIVGVGRAATKDLDTFKNQPKVYETTILLGASSDTGDLTGTITETTGKIPTTEEVTICLQSFVGKQEQTPPMYSAKKIAGQKLYNLARQGVTIPRLPEQIELYDLTLIQYIYPRLSFRVHCSTGTYIRVLAEDVGKRLGTTAYCETLTRTAIGPYTLDQAYTPEEAIPLAQEIGGMR